MFANNRRIARVAICAAIVASVAACSTPEDKVESYTKRGNGFLQKGDLGKARVEFQNALQINPNSVGALYGLADLAERSREWARTYQTLMKVVELDATHLPARIRIAKLLLASGQLDKAMEVSEAALQLKSDNPDALALRSAVLFKLQDTKGAIDFAKRALAKEPQNMDALFVLASERLQAGDAEGAVAFLDKGLEANERNVAVQLIKVQALERLARTDKAEGVLKRLISLFPDNAQYRYLLAQFYYAHADAAKAEGEYRAVISSTPDATPPKLELVKFIAGSRGLEAAAGELETMLKAHPKELELKHSLASVRLQQGKRDVALGLFKEIGDQERDQAASIRARGVLAGYYFETGDKAAAKPIVDQILQKDTRNEQGLLLRATMGMSDRRLDDAVADLRTILRDVPDSARAQLLLGRAHELQGLPDLATTHYGRAAQAGRYAPQFSMPYADYLMRTNRAKQAEGVLKETLRAAPNYVPAQKLLVQFYLGSGNIVAAQALADELERTGGDKVAASQMKGAVFAARKDFDNSVAAFRRAYDQSPTEVQPMVALVRSYLMAGKPAEALSFMQSVVKTSPDNRTGQLLYAQLLLQTGNKEGAKQAFEKLIASDAAEPGPYLGLASLHERDKRYEDALAVLERGLKAVPKDFGLRLARAGTTEVMGQQDKAIVLYEELLAERPNAVVVANNLANLLADTRKDQQSVKRAYELAQRFRGSDIPLMKDTLGWTAHLAGKSKDAADLLKSASSEVPNVAVVQYHFGINQLALNNRDTARKALERSIELAKATPFPQLDDAKKTLQGL